MHSCVTQRMQICVTAAWISGLQVFLTDDYPLAACQVPEELLKFGTAVKKKESSMYGAHFKDVDIKAKATKVTFDSDEDDE